MLEKFFSGLKNLKIKLFNNLQFSNNRKIDGNNNLITGDITFTGPSYTDIKNIAVDISMQIAKEIIIPQAKEEVIKVLNDFNLKIKDKSIFIIE
jgi:hypothetical protein